LFKKIKNIIIIMRRRRRRIIDIIETNRYNLIIIINIIIDVKLKKAT
jgi:hypothetical protein